MKTNVKSTFQIIVLFSLLCGALLVFASGCESGMRLAPAEPQKKIALQAHLTARDIEASGTDAHSPAARQQVQATQVALAYTGLPKNPVIEDYSTTVAQAQANAAQRPTAEQAFEAVEGGLSLAVELAILFGVGGAGFGGKKVMDWLKLAREKNKALQEIVTGNELFQISAKNSGIDNAVTAFKEAQNAVQKSPATKRLVTELKS